MPDRAPLLVLGNPTDHMLGRLAERFDITKLADQPDGWLADNGRQFAHATMLGHTVVGPAFFDAVPNLKVFANYGVGYDSIDAAEAARRGIIVTHTPDVLNAEVATTAIMLMMACYRELLRDDAYVRAGRWEAEGGTPLTRTVDGQTVGILGLGRRSLVW